MARSEFKASIKVAREKHAGGKCEECHAPLSIGKYHFDHVTPDGLTGQPTFENCRVLCIPCHREKTATDVADIAKAKRREAAHKGASTAPAKSIESAPMPKAEKARKNINPLGAPRPMFVDQ
jgi:5-methylcytosine-specific restriction protein A